MAFFCSLCIVGFCGCTHIHNPSKADQSRAALQQFETFRTNAGGVFGVMLTNLYNLEEIAKKRLEQGSEKLLDLRLQAAGTMRWSRFAAQLSSAIADYERLQTETQRRLNARAAEQGRSRQGREEANIALGSSRKSEKEAKAEADRWEARQRLTRGVIVYFADHPELLKAPDKKALDAARTAILGQKFKGYGGEQTLGAVLKDDWDAARASSQPGSNRLTALARAYLVDPFDPNKAPGLRVEIASLATDIATAEFRRAQARVLRLDAELENLNRTTNSLAEIKFIMEEIKEDWNLLITLPSNSTNRIRGGSILLETIGAYQQDLRKAEPTSRIEMQKELAYVFRLMARQLIVSQQLGEIKALLDLNEAILQHEESIRISEVNLQQRGALVSRGLGSLVRYHEGGLTPEQIANLLRSAEAAGIGLIGARIND